MDFFTVTFAVTKKLCHCEQNEAISEIASSQKALLAMTGTAKHILMPPS